MTVKTAVIDPAFANVKDVAGLAKLALQLERSPRPPTSRASI